MNNKRLWGLVLTALLAIALMLLPAAGLADAGSFSGDSDYGGSDWGDSDWGSDWGDSDWSSSSGDHYYTDGDSGGFGSIIGIVVVIIIVAYVMSKRNKKGGSGGAGGSGYTTNPGAELTELPFSIEDLEEIDPNFSAEALKEKIANLYIRMQECWQNKEWEQMRASMTDALYNQMNSQLSVLIRNHQTNYVERIAVLGVELTGFDRDEKNDIVTAIVRTRIVDYTLNDSTGALISGNRTAEKFLTYEWTLVRTKGEQTAKADGDETLHCPNCGAPLDINHTAKCEYCGSIITAAEYDWVISAIKGISQRTS